MTREEAIETINELWTTGTGNCPKGEFNELCEIIIKALEQEPRWIPVSERLPEETGTYLVTLEYKEHGTGITTLWFHGSFGWDLRVADVVVAWMPLPKPYEPKESEEKK